MVSAFLIHTYITFVRASLFFSCLLFSCWPLLVSGSRGFSGVNFYCLCRACLCWYADHSIGAWSAFSRFSSRLPPSLPPDDAAAHTLGKYQKRSHLHFLILFSRVSAYIHTYIHAVQYIGVPFPVGEACRPVFWTTTSSSLSRPQHPLRFRRVRLAPALVVGGSAVQRWGVWDGLCHVSVECPTSWRCC